MTTAIYYSKQFQNHDNAGHPENAERLTSIIDDINSSPLFSDIQFIEPELLPEERLYTVHSKEMINLIKETSNEGDTWIDLDTYVCKSDYDIARLAAGAVDQACTAVIKNKIDNAFALVRPPGHHARYDRSMGFCLFNNAAIAAHKLAKDGKHVLIFDHDVHHGNGTQYIFYNRNDIMYQSIHLSPHYPGTGDLGEVGSGDGEGYTLNVPLMFGQGDKTVRKIMDYYFLPIAEQFYPDIILISAGFDSHHTDPLGGLKLTTNFFGEMITKLQQIQPKIVCTLEGGYNLQWLGKCVLSELGQMMNQPLLFDDTVTNEVTLDNTYMHQLSKTFKKYWAIKNI